MSEESLVMGPASGLGVSLKVRGLFKSRNVGWGQ